MTFLRAALFAAASLSAARAQDTRRVEEPKFPPACVSLAAGLHSVDGHKTLAEADEASPDTARIQHAIDACPAGHAVALQPDGARDAFLSGPLQLRDGVTLLVAAGAVLFASRNPRDYDATPGVCGTVDRSGRGCRPLIAAARVSGAGVMGDGVIDGRGWARLTGRNQSWWDLAEQARSPQDAKQNCPRLVVASAARAFTLYPPHRPPQFAKFSRHLQRGRLHRLGRHHRLSQDRAQHRRNRPRQRHQRHHHPLLYPCRR